MTPERLAECLRLVRWHKDVLAEALQGLGLSLYEARLYLGLLKGGPQNGNELSRSSGVPSSKVYGMLDRLVES